MLKVNEQILPGNIVARLHLELNIMTLYQKMKTGTGSTEDADEASLLTDVFTSLITAITLIAGLIKGSKGNMMCM